jgi:hypothetical protein
MNVVFGLLLSVVFLASVTSVLGGAVMKYAVTEGRHRGGLDTEAAGTILLVGGIFGFILFIALLAIWVLVRRRGDR